ncbi:hypothetical protein M8J76_011567 [Diaphorina citri]|nr:hypothetical protein M8J76_011567 [Diaphorina citri]
MANLKIYVKLGVDNKNIGACLESQCIVMLAHLKKSAHLIDNYTIIKVNPSKPPESFTSLGLRLRIPCIVLNNDAIDDPDEILTTLEDNFPGGLLKNEFESDAEIATRNFFSRFSFYVRGVAKDCHNLEQEFLLINQHLEKVITRDSNNLFLCGSQMSLIDCQILPKLHQVRVALQSILNYEIPVHYRYIWKYLHSAYNNAAFVEACPPDEDIICHWSNKSQPLPVRKSNPNKPLYSFSIPVRTDRIMIED